MDWLRCFWYGYLVVVAAMGVYILGGLAYCMGVSVRWRDWGDVGTYLLQALSAAVWLAAAILFATHALELLEWLP